MRAATHIDGEPPMSAFAALQHYGVCIQSIVANTDPLARELFELWRDLDGTKRLQTIRDWYDVPAIYVGACRVIESKFAELAALKRDNRGS